MSVCKCSVSQSPNNGSDLKSGWVQRLLKLYNNPMHPKWDVIRELQLTHSYDLALLGSALNDLESKPSPKQSPEGMCPAEAMQVWAYDATLQPQNGHNQNWVMVSNGIKTHTIPFAWEKTHSLSFHDLLLALFCQSGMRVWLYPKSHDEYPLFRLGVWLEDSTKVETKVFDRAPTPAPHTTPTPESRPMDDFPVLLAVRSAKEMREVSHKHLSALVAAETYEQNIKRLPSQVLMDLQGHLNKLIGRDALLGRDYLYLSVHRIKDSLEVGVSVSDAAFRGPSEAGDGEEFRIKAGTIPEYLASWITKILQQMHYSVVAQDPTKEQVVLRVSWAD